MFTDILQIWSDSPALSLAIWLIIAITLMYLGRPHAHQVLQGTGRAIHATLRAAAMSIGRLEQRIDARNRDVLLAQGREETEKAIEREFSRVHAIIDRDLGQYPALHGRLSEILGEVEADYQAATDSAPLPPAWSEVVATISALPESGDPAVARILEDIKEAVDNSHRETLAAYREQTRERHRILDRMRPRWRALSTTLDKVQATITGLDERARAIDRHMADYESIRQGENRAVNTLTASSLTQFLVATLVLTIAGFGALINFHLIALPMSEMVGGASYIGAVRASDVAALVIIMVEITMGIFLLEALGITHLFPLIGRMDDRMRRRMAIVAFAILLLFACIEASLAYLRDLLALDRAALQQSLAEGAAATAAEAPLRWIPSLAQMMLGFILPFALAFVAIPLEAFVHSLRTVLGLVALGLLRLVRVTLRLAGNLAAYLARMLVSLYDFCIMLPVSIEHLIIHHRRNAARRPEAEKGTASSTKKKKSARRESTDKGTELPAQEA